MKTKIATLLLLLLLAAPALAQGRWGESVSSSGGTGSGLGLFPLSGVGTLPGSTDGRCNMASQSGGIGLVIGLQLSAVGTFTNAALANTSLAASLDRIEGLSLAGAGSSSEIRTNASSYWIGNAADRGGFSFWSRWGIASAVATQRAFTGMAAQTGAIANVDPNTLVNTIYVGCNSAEADLSVCSNDGAGNATCTGLGASFPCKTAGALYDFAFTAPRQTTSIPWRVTRIDTPAEALGTITTDLPANNVFLSWHQWLNNGATASAVTLSFVGTCLQR